MRVYDSMRSRLPSARARLEQSSEARSVPSLTDGTDNVVSPPESAADMDRSDLEATAGNEPMDE